MFFYILRLALLPLAFSLSSTNVDRPRRSSSSSTDRLPPTLLPDQVTFPETAEETCSDVDYDKYLTFEKYARGFLPGCNLPNVAGQHAVLCFGLSGHGKSTFAQIMLGANWRYDVGNEELILDSKPEGVRLPEVRFYRLQGRIYLKLYRIAVLQSR